jgi:N-methylhydantoinase A
MRYRRQTHELIIPFESGGASDHPVRELVERFERTYEATYGPGAGFREAGVEMTTFRVEAVGKTHKPRLAQLDADSRTGSDHVPARRRQIYDAESHEWVKARVHDWESLGPHEVVEGIAVLEHPTTTVLIAAGQTASADRFGNLVITMEAT